MFNAVNHDRDSTTVTDAGRTGRRPQLRKSNRLFLGMRARARSAASSWMRLRSSSSKFPLQRAGPERIEELSGGAAQELLEFLCQLPRENHLAIREELQEFADEFFNAVG